MILKATLITAMACAGAVLIWTFAAPPVRAAECAGRMVKASWYGTESGNRTYTGDYFDGTSMTAAMPDKRHIGERYRVTHNGKSVIVKVNDFGPARYLGRGMDLSKAAFAKLANTRKGVIAVCIVKVR